MALIKCENLKLGYEGQVILENINFELKGGEYLCIIGENGAGKSTLVKALLKLKKTMGGSIELGDGLRAKEIGYLPQQTLAQKDFPASVFEVVISGRLNNLSFLPFYTKADKEDAMDKMRLMGIENLKNKCYNDLSGGQQQRVLLARAMCATKKVILLDEPATGLDPVVTAEFYELISKINKDMGITVIMVSHDMEATLKYASHIMYLSQNNVFYGTKEAYLTSEAGMKYGTGEGAQNND